MYHRSSIEALFFLFSPSWICCQEFSLFTKNYKRYWTCRLFPFLHFYSFILSVIVFFCHFFSLFSLRRPLGYGTPNRVLGRLFKLFLSAVLNCMVRLCAYVLISLFLISWRVTLEWQEMLTQGTTPDLRLRSSVYHFFLCLVHSFCH